MDNNNERTSFKQHNAVLNQGTNCWTIEQADRLNILVDTADYFDAFYKTCLNAQKQIFILGWDFDRSERLHRDAAHRELPDVLGKFLGALVKRRKDLQIYLLSWDFNLIYSAEREFLPALRLRLDAPRRFHIGLDGHHPVGASHHQKIVVVDDRVAFVGGIDLSRWRWDTCEHKPDDPRRKDPNGKSYPPFHDMMMMLEGPVATRLGDLARERWRRTGRRKIDPPEPVKASPWPDSIASPLTHAHVAIARTEPAFAGRDAVTEVKRLYLDAISSAKEFVYIESQYFTSASIMRALRERLQEAQGPEVVLVLPEKTGGWLEQVTMDVLRCRVVDELTASDRHGRLRVYYPHQPGLGETCISVHAKLMIVDDKILRLGSSNTSGRSMGMDTECDVAIEAQTGDPSVGDFIRNFRHRLIAEHMACSIEKLHHTESEEKSLIRTIEALSNNERSLRPLDCSVAADVNEMVPDGELIDPPEPLSPDYVVEEYVPKHRRGHSRRNVTIFIGVLVAFIAMTVMWRVTPLQEWIAPDRMADLIGSIDNDGVRALVAIGFITIASLVTIPLTLLAIASGIVFDGWEAFLYTLIGALVSCVIGFHGGRLLGADRLDKMSGSRLSRLSKRLGERGTVAVAILRLVPIAPFVVFNLVAGISHLKFRQFFLGSVLGLTPGLGAITIFSDSLFGAVMNPTPQGIATVVIVGGVLILSAWLIKRWLRSR